MPPPRFLAIEPVGRCNLGCQLCSLQFPRGMALGSGAPLMPWEVFTRLLRAHEAVEELQLEGPGEPLLHPRFFDMVAFAVERGLRVSVSSNCTLLARRRARRLVASGLATLSASLDGATCSTYEAVRTGGRFLSVLRNLLLVRTVRERLGLARPQLRIVTVAMRRNLAELPAIVRLARRLGVREMAVQHFAPRVLRSWDEDPREPVRDFVRAESLLAEDPERVRAYFSRARQAAEECRVRLRLPELRLKEPPEGGPCRGPCGCPNDGLYIDYQGLAMPCCMLGSRAGRRPRLAARALPDQ
ncbi:MAG: radical SAM protein [Elusimicrobia bacterium]|nr:radical SAM protein [Elusimicrobiota bacterium]